MSKGAHKTTVLLDESGNNNPDQPLIVGSLQYDRDLANSREQIEALFDELSSAEYLEGLPSFAEFVSTGFHASGDPPEVSARMISHLSQSLAARLQFEITNRLRYNASETELLLHMYMRILKRIAQKGDRRSAITVIIEQNEEIRPYIENLARALSKQTRGTIEITMVGKRDEPALAIIDYMMMIISRWDRAGSPSDPRDNSYRLLRQFDNRFSLVESLEYGVLANRRRRLTDLAPRRT